MRCGPRGGQDVLSSVIGGSEASGYALANRPCWLERRQGALSMLYFSKQMTSFNVVSLPL